ncbi:MAG: ankyrin repeat domain-containing protein, partial [Verrucomicrobia bacterium]|nr:ankyrin repeat domain-containing protein [Verrucomicrobiota bacterium]
GQNWILRLLHARGRSLTSFDENGLAPVHHATKKSKLKTLRCLHSLSISLDTPITVEETKDNIDPPTPSPIHFASRYGTAALVQWLVDHKADPAKITVKKHNALSSATRNSAGDAKAIISFLKDIKIHTERGERPLFCNLDYLFPAAEFAIGGDAIDALELIYDLWLPPETEFENGANGLALACMAGSLRATSFFLQLGLDCTTSVRSGETALELSAMNKSIDQFRYLLTQTQPDLTRENKKGQNLLHLAVKAGNFSHVALLLDRGIDIDKQDVQGITPLLLAAEYDYRDIIELLMLCGANPELRQRYTGYIPEDLATPEGKKIIQQIKVMKERATEGGTALHIAVATDNAIAVQIIGPYVDINQQNVHGHTALHEAVIHEKLQHVRELLANGADASIKDIHGKSAA